MSILKPENGEVTHSKERCSVPKGQTWARHAKFSVSPNFLAASSSTSASPTASKRFKLVMTNGTPVLMIFCRAGVQDQADSCAPEL